MKFLYFNCNTNFLTNIYNLYLNFASKSHLLVLSDISQYFTFPWEQLSRTTCPPCAV